MIGEKNRYPASLASPNKLNGGSPGERVHVNDVWTLFVEDCPECGRRFRIAPAVELLQHVSTFGCRSKAPHSPAVVIVGLIGTPARRRRKNRFDTQRCRAMCECFNKDLCASDWVGTKGEEDV